MLIAGLAMIGLGMLAICFPMAAGVSAELFFGALMLAAGVLHFSTRVRGAETNSIGHIAIAGLFIGIGLLLAAFPVVGVFSLDLITGVGFFLQGVIQIAVAISRPQARGRGMLGAGGIFAATAGGAILCGWPFESAWVFGALIGANLIFVGAGLLLLYRGARSSLA